MGDQDRTIDRLVTTAVIVGSAVVIGNVLTYAHQRHPKQMWQGLGLAALGLVVMWFGVNSDLALLAGLGLSIWGLVVVARAAQWDQAQLAAARAQQVENWLASQQREISDGIFIQSGRKVSLVWQDDVRTTTSTQVYAQATVLDEPGQVNPGSQFLVRVVPNQGGGVQWQAES